MWCKLLLSVVVALSATLVAVYLSHPVPDDVEFTTEARAATILIKLVNTIGLLMDRLGLMGEARFSHWSSQALSPFMRGPDDPMVQTEEMTMAGTRVVVYHYLGGDNPKQHGLAPALIFIHGGGWVLLNTDYYHQCLQWLTRKSKLMVISVEYTLVPDARFPEPVYENAAVYKYFVENAHKFGNDKNRIILMGDSAGGNLVAAVSILLRDEKFKPQPTSQILIYPVLQMFDVSLPSYQNSTGLMTSLESLSRYVLWYLYGDSRYHAVILTNQHVSSKTLNRHQHKLSHQLLPQSYLPDHYKPTERLNSPGIDPEFDELITNPLFSPLLADDLSGLPQSLVITCRYDVLRDEGYLYADRMRKAGVAVKYVDYKHRFHGSQIVDPQFTDDIVSYIRDIVRY